MSRTLKKWKLGQGFLRHPRGSKQAKAHGVRDGAVPRNEYDDICPSKESQKCKKRFEDK